MASSLASGASPPAKHKLCIFVESRETARGWQLCQPTPRASSIKVLSVKRTRALLPPNIVCSHGHCCPLFGAGAVLAGGLSGPGGLQKEMLFKPPLPCRVETDPERNGDTIPIASPSSQLPLPCLDTVKTVHSHYIAGDYARGLSHCLR